MAQHVTATDIADLVHRIRRLTEQHPADAVEQAAVLARKADLLARIADQRAEESGPCDYTTQAREIAHEARAIAENAHRLVRTATRPAGGAKSQENPPRSRQPGGARSEENSGGQFWLTRPNRSNARPHQTLPPSSGSLPMAPG